jgi:tetratricopeptide (TPR) repeat protein
MRRRVVLLSGLSALALLGALVLAWACGRRPDIHYLPEDGPGHWILYPAAAHPGIHLIGERTTVFSRSFDLPQPPTHAPLRARAFGGFTVQVNGQLLVASESSLARDWKRAVEVDAASALAAGENRLTITVSNDEGPPSLWLALQAGDLQIVSDSQWECSLLGAASQPARLAAEPPELRNGSPAVDGESAGEALARGWPALLLLLVLAAVGMIALDLGMRRGSFASARRVPWLILILASIAVPWLVLVLNNCQSLHFAIGYDALHHVEYIRYVRQHGALPLASEGFEMHQPPLYYLLSAAALKVCGLQAEEVTGLLLLRGLTLLTGIAFALLLASCLRLLMPKAPGQQAVGLVVAACLPVHLYLMHSLSNDLLAGALATAAVYVGLTVVQAERPSHGRLTCLGLCLGAAVLTKLTTVAVVVVILAVLAGHLAARRSPVSAWLRTLGLPLLVCLAVSSWFFLRNVYHFGTPLIGSYDPRSGFRWWQEPGYAMAAQGLRFGRSLSHPFYSAFTGIPDGLYSTLWGDGGWGGATTVLDRPPWDYDRMVAAYLLALVPSGLVVVGVAAAVIELVRRPRPEGFLLVGLPAGLGLAMLYHYLHYPFYCHLKAFYALPAVLSLCACAGLGFETLTRGRRLWRLVLGAALGAWALAAYTSFWVNGDAATTQVWVARQYLREGNNTQAAACLERVLQRDRDNPQARRLLGQMLLMAKQPDKAVVQLQRAIKANPGDTEAHFLLASGLVSLGQNGPAGWHLEQAIALSPDSLPAYRLLARVRGLQADVRGTRAAAEEGLRVVATTPDLQVMLAEALAAEGRPQEAVEHYQIALRWQPNALAALKGLALLRATCEDSRYRDGHQAVQLAERASDLTHGQDIEALEVLASALAESGRFREAEQLLKNALASAQRLKREAPVERLQQHLRLYQQGCPLREKPRLGPQRLDRQEGAPVEGPR